MRGKKIDSNFVSNFILECVSNGKTVQDEIVEEAKRKISEIDEKIKEVEKLKSTRSKLIDVVFSLGNKKQPTEEVKNLNLFKIQNQHICKFICDSLKKESLDIASLSSKYNNFNLQDILFAIKQLIENKVIIKDKDFLIKGPEFNTYLKVVLMEK